MHARIGPIPFHIVELSSFRDAEHSADGRRTRFPFAMTSLVRIADTERSPRYQNIILRKPRAKQTTYFRIKKNRVPHRTTPLAALQSTIALAVIRL